jgi:putative ABC transport system permease protein
MKLWWYTLQFSLRMLSTRPGMTLLAVLTMGIGIGVTSSQVMIVEGLLYPRLPLPRSEQLVSVVSVHSDGSTQSGTFHSHLIRYWKEHQHTLSSTFTFIEGTINVYAQNRAIRYNGSWVSADFFETLGVTPYLGEGFRPGDDELEMPKKAVLGFETWQKDFGSDPSVIGRDILVNGESTMVVGVMPREFAFPYNAEIWVPDVFYPGELVAYDPTPATHLSGRLHVGNSREAAAAELSELKQDFLQKIPSDFRETFGDGVDVSVLPFAEAVVTKDTREILIFSSAVVLLVLLIACANVTNLLLAGFATRMKEVAVRSALGASGRDLALQMWMESLLISAAGAVLGAIYCMWAADWGNAQLANMQTPFWYQLQFTPLFFAVVALVTVLVSILAAALPLWRSGRLSIHQILQDDSRTGSSLSINATNKTLVVLQISISCALLTVAGMMLKQIHQARSVEFGYDSRSVLTARMGLMEGTYKTAVSRAIFIEQLLEVLADQSEITSAAISTRMQLIQLPRDVKVRVAGTDGTFTGDPLPVFSDGISEQFFETLGLGMIAGDGFRRDTASGNRLRQVMVTESFAREQFAVLSEAIGARLQSIQEMGSVTATEEHEIVAVVPDTFLRGTFLDDSGMVGGVHFHYSVAPTRFITVVIRPSGDMNSYSLVPLLKRCVAEVDPEIPLYFVQTPDDALESEFAGVRFIADLFVVFSTVALILSFVGIFAITSFSILQRMQEIGIRKALGATEGQVFLSIMQKAGLELLLGLLLGSLAGATLGYALHRTSIKTELWDPVVFLAVMAILTLSSLLATLYPARKAAKILPAEATRVV